MANQWATHRPVVMGKHGMVATGHPLASVEALHVLRQGGNAVDAALTAAAVLAVVKPNHCGLGGDAFMMIYSSKDGKVHALNGSGKSPFATKRVQYERGIPERGFFAATVPGAVDAWIEAAKRFGSREFKDILRPAIKCAEEGFPAFPNLLHVIESSSAALSKDQLWAGLFMPGGKVPRAGQLLRQEDLARSLSAIAEGGREVFYRGWIAEAVVRASQEKGGNFSLRDFEEHHSKWEEPLCAVYRGYEVYVPPPNSYGLLLLLQLKLLENYGLLALGHNTAEYLTCQLEIKDRAWSDGMEWIADPGAVSRPDLERFIRSYPVREATDHAPVPKFVLPQEGGTTYVAAVDSRGNWVSLIESLFYSFGSGVVVEGTGMVLNNRMVGFNLIEGHPNELDSHKRPAHTLSPALVLKDGRPYLAIGTPGGVGQTQFLAQLLCNLLDFGMDVQQAIEAPRWRSERERTVELEERFPGGVEQTLRERGYQVAISGAWNEAMGGAEAILLDAESGVFLAGADPRRDGYAMGW